MQTRAGPSNSATGAPAPDAGWTAERAGGFRAGSRHVSGAIAARLAQAYEALEETVLARVRRHRASRALVNGETGSATELWAADSAAERAEALLRREINRAAELLDDKAILP